MAVCFDRFRGPTNEHLYYDSEPEGVCKDSPDGNVRVVERVDRVELWEAKDDPDEDDPDTTTDDRDWIQEFAEAERSLN